MTRRRGHGIIILAGGRSSRMGKNKALLDFGGKPLLKHVLDSLASYDNMVIVIGKEHSVDEYRRILPKEVKLIQDTLEIKAPLAGIIEGLKLMAKEEYVALLSCDLPFVRKDVLDFLYLEVTGYDAAVPIWKNGLVEPLYAVYRVLPLARAVQHCLASAKYKNLDLIQSLGKVKYVDEERLRVFDSSMKFLTNINSMEDLERARREAFKS